MMERKSDAEQDHEQTRPLYPPFVEVPDFIPKDPKEPRNVWWSGEQFPPKPILNLATAEPLIDLKQETSNKGEDPNLHLVHDFETEEIERAKEYEHRA